MKVRAYHQTRLYGKVVILADVTESNTGERTVQIRCVSPVNNAGFQLLEYERETGMPCGFSHSEIEAMKKVVLNSGEAYECKMVELFKKHIELRNQAYAADDKIQQQHG